MALAEETRIGAEQVALGEVGGTIEFGTWWSRLGGGFVTPAMFWAPDRVDASPRCEHVPFLFWLVDAQRPFTLVELTETPGAAYLRFARRSRAYACRRAAMQFAVKCHGATNS